MSFSCGIVGLPNVGKSTIFNCLTKGSAEVSDYPFCTINPNAGAVRIPDARMEKLDVLLKPEEMIPARVEFIDIAGLVEGASHGEGLGNRFLAEIRQVDTVLHIAGCFRSEGASPVEGIKVVDTELALSDMELVERRVEKVEQMVKSSRGSSEETAVSPREERELLLKVKGRLERGIPVRLQAHERENFPPELWTHLLTAKPVIIVANVGEKDIERKIDELEDYGKTERVPILYISALLESELLQLRGDEVEEFRSEMGLTESALDRLVAASFTTLGLITFYTVVREKVSAWTVRRGTFAPQAAGKIHSDMERSFIKAEVISFSDFEECGSVKQAREKGLVRIEGKSYSVQDGDIVYFHFRP